MGCGARGGGLQWGGNSKFHWQTEIGCGLDRGIRLGWWHGRCLWERRGQWRVPSSYFIYPKREFATNQNENQCVWLTACTLRKGSWSLVASMQTIQRHCRMLIPKQCGDKEWVTGWNHPSCVSNRGWQHTILWHQYKYISRRSPSTSKQLQEISNINIYIWTCIYITKKIGPRLWSDGFVQTAL